MFDMRTVSNGLASLSLILLLSLATHFIQWFTVESGSANTTMLAQLRHDLLFEYSDPRRGLPDVSHRHHEASI